MLKGKHLITTDNWFYAPDGQQYRAAWGNVTIISDDVLGIKTNARSANWFAQVGDGENSVLIAGCQIHYSVKCENRPSNNPCKSENFHEGKMVENKLPSRIYFTE